jgi:hypothetical protein
MVFFKFSSFIAVIIKVIVTSYMKNALNGSVISTVFIYTYKTFARDVLVSLVRMSLISRAVECQ